MVVFREEKSYGEHIIYTHAYLNNSKVISEEEIRTWLVWHRRQHNLKQRILEVDVKNSSGILGQFEEVALNTVQFHWNPNEQPFPKVL
jgi:hypothetical protein